MRSPLLLSILLLPVLTLSACRTARAPVITQEDAVSSISAALEIPQMFDPELDFITLGDFSEGWNRYTTPGGKLSFLYPPSWEVDAGEWNITNTIFVGTPVDASHPVNLLLTVHDIGELEMVEALQQQFEQIRINPLTSRIVSTETAFLDPGQGSGRTIVAYRTTLNANQSFLHLIIPRRSSILTIETPSIDPLTAYPVRVLLESIVFRD